jgi:hypothetical protein
MGEAFQPSHKKVVVEKLNHSTPSVVKNKPSFTKLGQDVVGNENI